MPPFTIHEFSALVSAALDGDGPEDKTADFSLYNARHAPLNQSTTGATPISTFVPTRWPAMSTIDHSNDCMGLLPTKTPQTSSQQQKKPLALFSKIKRQLTSKANATSAQQSSVSHALPSRHGKSAAVPTVTFSSDLNFRSATNFDDTDDSSLASTTTTMPKQALQNSSPPSIASASLVSTPSVYSCASLVGSLPEENRPTFETDRSLASRLRTIPSTMSAETCSVLSSNLSHCTDESDYIPFLPLVLQQERLARQIPLPKAVPLNAASWSTASLNSRKGNSLEVTESRTRTLSHISSKRPRKPMRQESLPAPLLHHARSTPLLPINDLPVANAFDHQNPPSPTSSLETRGPVTPSTPQFALDKPQVKEVSDSTSDSSRPSSTDGKEKAWPVQPRVIHLNPESIARERTLSSATSPSSSPTPYDSASPRRPSQRVRARSRESRPPPRTPPPSLPLPTPLTLNESEPSRPPSTVSVPATLPKDGLKPSSSHAQFLTMNDVLHPDNLSPKRSRDRLASRRSSPLHDMGGSPAGSRVQSKVWTNPPSPETGLRQEDEVAEGSSSAKTSLETDHRRSTEEEEVDIGAGVFIKVRVKKENIGVARQLPQPTSTTRSKSKKSTKLEWTLRLGADESEPEAKHKMSPTPTTIQAPESKDVYVTAENAFGDVTRMRMRTKSESAVRSLGHSGRERSGKSRYQPKEKLPGRSDDWTLSLPLPSLRDYERSRHVSTIGTEKGWAEPLRDFGDVAGNPRSGPVIRVRDVAGGENELVQDDVSSQISSLAGKEDGGVLRVPRVVAETRTTPRQRHMTLPSVMAGEETVVDDEDEDEEIEDPKVKENLAKLAALDEDLARFNALLKSTNASATSGTKKGRKSLSPSKLKPSKSSSFFDFNSASSIIAESTPKRTRTSSARPTRLIMNEDVSAPFDSGLASPKHAILRALSTEVLFEPKPAHVRSSSVITSASSSSDSECAGLTLPVLSPAPEAVQPKPLKVQLSPANFVQPISLPSPPASPPPMSPTTSSLPRTPAKSRTPLPFAPSLAKPLTPTSPQVFAYGSASGFAPSSLLAGNVTTPIAPSRGLVLTPPSLIGAADQARVRSASTASSRPSTSETMKKAPPPMLKIQVSASPPPGSPPQERSPLKTPTSTRPASSNPKGLMVNTTGATDEDWRTSFMSMSSDTSMTPTIPSPGGYQSDECGPTPLASFFPTPPPLSEAYLRAVRESLEEGVHTGISGIGHIFGCVPPGRSCSSSSARTSSSGTTVKPSKVSPGGSARSSARSSMAHGRAESGETDVRSMESGTYYTARSSFSEWF